MAVHLRSLNLKSTNLPYILTRCFVSQVQCPGGGDKRSISDVEWERLAKRVTLLCEEAKRHVNDLPQSPAATTLALLVLESQKLVEAVNKHMSLTSPNITKSQSSVLNNLTANQNALSWSKLKGYSLSKEPSDPSLETGTELAIPTNHNDLKQEIFSGLGVFVQPYSYTTDDIIIRGDLQKEGFSLGVESQGTDMIGITGTNQQLLENPSGQNNDLSGSRVFCALPSSSESPEPPVGPPPPPMKGGPDPEKLIQFRDHFVEALPKFFVTRHDYRIYHQDMVFENNYWGTNLVTRGLNAYASQLIKYRIFGMLKFAHMEVTILKATTHPEDGTVRIRWRIKGLSQFKALMFWKFLPWTYKKSIKNESQWYDGYSVYTVNKEGFVIKHRVDRVIPDEEMQTVKPASDLALKLSIMLGLAPKPGLNDFTGLFSKKISDPTTPKNP